MFRMDSSGRRSRPRRSRGSSGTPNKFEVLVFVNLYVLVSVNLYILVSGWILGNGTLLFFSKFVYISGHHNKQEHRVDAG
jgi:hypothetical protein